MADLDDVLRMFSSLTRISQIETTTRTSGFRSVDLVEVTEAVVDLYDAAAEDKDVDLAVIGDKPVVITGDRDLLFDAVANLVDNAIKHGREAGRVTVQLSRGEADAVISVADNGQDPASEHQHVSGGSIGSSVRDAHPATGWGSASSPPWRTSTAPTSRWQTMRRGSPSA